MPSKTFIIMTANLLVFYIAVFSIPGIDGQDLQLPYNYTCPQLFLKPCKCATADQVNIQQIQVYCEVLNIKPDFPDFSVIPSGHTTVLYIECNDIYNSYLYPGVLQNLTDLEELALISCKINRLSAGSLLGLQNLQALNISYVIYEPDQPGLTIEAHAFTHNPYLQLLSLPRLKITHLPPAVFCGLKQLKYLDLTDNLLSDENALGFVSNLSGDAGLCLPELATLGLGGNRLKSLQNPFVNNAPHLIGLFLNYNYITFLGEGIFTNLSRLSYLDLAHNSLKILNEDIFKGLNNLLTLNIEHNLIHCVSNDILQDNINLTILNIGHNHMTSNCLPNLSHLSKLQEINLRYNKIDTLTAMNLKGLPDLTSLQLQGNRLDTLRISELHILQHLHYLNLSSNHLRLIINDTQDSNDMNLKILDLSRNKFVSLTTLNYSFLPNLQELYLNHNRLTKVPNQPNLILSSLGLLDLNYNAIDNLHQDDFTSFPFLQYLLLKNNNISYVSKHGFRTMPMITLINLSNNRIQSVEYQAFNNLQNLQYLSLNHNQIARIDLVFNFIPNLRVLFINNNHIKELKAEHLPRSIQSVDISFNNIHTLDSILGQLPNLISFDLSHNKLRKVNKYNLLLNSAINGFKRPSVKLAGNYLFCDCHMQYLQKINTNLLGNENYPVVTDLNNIICKSLTPGKELKFLVDLESRDFLCEYCPTDTYGCDSDIQFFCPQSECPCCSYDYHLSQTCSCSQQCPNTCDCLVSGDRNYHKVDCSHKLLDDIPKQSLPYATHVHFDGNFLTRIDRYDFNYNTTMLKYLYLNDSHVRNIEPYSFQSLQSLETIYLQGNKIEKLESNTFNGLLNLKEINLQNNSIHLIDVDSFNGLETLEILRLDNNNLTQIDLTSLERVKNIKELYLSGNNWFCDCTFGPELQIWIIAHSQKVKDEPECGHIANHVNSASSSVLKIANSSYAYHIIVNSSEHRITWLNFDSCKNLTRKVVIHEASKALLPTTLVLAVLFSSIIIGMLVVYKYRDLIQVWIYTRYGLRFFNEVEDNDDEKIYDAFISYSSHDESFVVHELVPTLEEGEPPYKACVHYRDWIIGYGIAESVISSVHSSRRTILLLSKEFIQSEWCNYEFQTAHHQVLKDKKCRLIVVLLDDEPPEGIGEELQLYISSHTYIKRSDPWFWERLKYALPSVTPDRAAENREGKRRERHMIQKTKDAMIQLDITDVHGLNQR